MAQPANELRCIGLIANLEGFKKLPLPQDASSMTDLASLDSRLRNLEKAMYVALPTPDADPSWLGLTTRLWRLRNNILKDGIAVFLGREATAVQDFQSMLPDVDISLDSIKKAVGSIRTLAPRTEWPKSSSGEQMMSVILQTLYAAQADSKAASWADTDTQADTQEQKGLLQLLRMSLSLNGRCERPKIVEKQTRATD
ncbi:hypothetical protein MANI_116149 [Metarhizium anisopliae]|nr:hypothetical protein MANI_116149 [Metarhizium anisopliae]